MVLLVHYDQLLNDEFGDSLLAERATQNEWLHILKEFLLKTTLGKYLKNLSEKKLCAVNRKTELNC